MKAPIAAMAIVALAACAGAPEVAEHRTAAPGPIECARLTQPEIPGGHGGYGGLYDEEHPYYLPERREAPPERRSTFVDPYFNPGEDPVQLQAYRACLLREPPRNG